MATSSGQNDSGVFELNFRDERYLPFEGEGVESQWTLSINKDFATFNLDSISDVVLHLHYTSRDGGDILKNAAIASFNLMQSGFLNIDGISIPHSRLFSLRHDFPNEWVRFQSQIHSDEQRNYLNLTLRQEHYPFWSIGKINGLQNIKLFVKSNEFSESDTMEVFDSADRNSDTHKDILNKESELGDLFVGEFENMNLPEPMGSFNLCFETNKISDLWLLVEWKT
jgi:hypothetical protein